MRFSRTRSAKMMSSPWVRKTRNPACARAFFSSCWVSVAITYRFDFFDWGKTALGGQATARGAVDVKKDPTDREQHEPDERAQAETEEAKDSNREAQAADLQSGKWYFNVHTAAHGPGEIRGQLMKK